MLVTVYVWSVWLTLTITSAEYLNKTHNESSTKKLDYDNNKSHESINVGPLINIKNNTNASVIISEGGLSIDKGVSGVPTLKSNVTSMKVEEKHVELLNSTKLNNTIALPNNKTKISHSSITPRKGVDYDSHESMRKDFNVTSITNSSLVPLNISISANHTTNSTGKIVTPKKPTVTTGEDEPYAPSHFVPPSISKVIHELTSESPHNLNDSAKILKKVYFDTPKNVATEPKYLIPLVISILIIPALLGMFVFIYKYGQDWWDRRHYRRMDYLIEGMYNN